MKLIRSRVILLILVFQCAAFFLFYPLFPYLLLGFFLISSFFLFILSASGGEIFLPSLIFSAVVAGVSLFSVYPPRAWIGTSYWISVAMAWQSFFSLEEQAREKLRNLLFVLGVGIALYAIWQRFYLYPRLSPAPDRVLGTFLHPNLLAVFLLSLLLWGWERRKPYPLLFLLMAGAALTFSYIPFLIGSIVWLSFSFRLREDRWKGALFLLIALIVVGSVLIFQGRAALLLGNLSLLEKGSSLWGRVEIWIGSLRMFFHHPIVGFGLGNFATYLPSFQVSAVYSTSSHSFLLYILSQTGIIGFFSFSYFLFTLIKKRAGKQFSGLLCFLLLQGLFDFSLDMPGMIFLLLYLLEYRPKAEKAVTRPLLTLSFLIFLMLFLPMSSALAYRQLGRIEQAQHLFPAFSDFSFSEYQICVRRKYWNCARHFLYRAYDQEPRHWLYVLHKAIFALSVDRDKEQASREADKLIRIAPYNPLAYDLALSLASSKKEIKEIEKAREKLYKEIKERHLTLPQSGMIPLAF